ncbi:MBL fold metallo-hydrolase [Streptosporangium sp. NPDC001559]|uniref:MBL fold metallo-hydrolase n=1 Tax=Streptosporangium sp. NPDC001559 TaxID=3366187 RepID=UPI0036EDC377
MKLHLIGTGSIFTDRMSACALIDDTLLIDTPNGSVKAMRRGGTDLTAIDICLITHFHADHFFDIIFLLMEQGLLRRRDRELVLVGPTGLQERIQHLFQLSYPGTWKTVKPNVRPHFVEFGHGGGQWQGPGRGHDYLVQAFAVQHTTPIALGYAITDAQSTTLGYTGDTVYCPAAESLTATSAVVVLDTSFRTSRVGHMGLDDVEALSRRWPDRTFIPTHLGDDVTGSDRPNIVFPDDGQTFTLNMSGLTDRPGQGDQ